MVYLTIHEGGHLRHVALSSFPIAIGRSGACQVVLESDSVSAHHAIIEQIDTESYVLKDQSSTNGTYAAGRRISEHTLNDGEIIHLADVEIQINFKEHLEKTRISEFSGDSLFQARLKKFSSHFFTVFLGWTILLFTTAFQTYLDYWPPEQPLKVPAQATKTFLTAAVATLILGLIGQLTTKKFYYRRSLLFICLILSYAETSHFLRGFASMNMPTFFPRWWMLVGIIVLIPLVAGALHRPLQMWRKRLRLLVAVVLVTLVIGADVFSEIVSRRVENEGRDPDFEIAIPWSFATPRPIKTPMLTHKLQAMAAKIDDVKRDIMLEELKDEDN